MTSLIGRTATSSTCRLLKNIGKKCVRMTDQLRISPRYTVCDIGRIRSYHWSMNKATSNFGSLQLLSSNFCKKCESRRMHTEGDKEFSEFLEKEIRTEKSSDNYSKPLPTIENWDVKTDESNVTMTRTVGGETIAITFNIVDSVNTDDIDDSFAMEGTHDQGEEQPPNMLSRPPFKVEIKKPSGKVLSLQCSFPLDEMDMRGQEGEDPNAAAPDDDFEIDEVAVYENKQSESGYSMLSSAMEGTMYDLLMDMLDERGINNEFVNVMTDYSTGYEQRQYVKFLKDLKSFIDEK